MKYKKEPFKKNEKKMIRIEILDDNYFFESAGEKIKIMEFEIYNKNTIYDKIRRGEPIYLHRKYVEDFSLTEYRGINKIGEERLRINKIDISMSFFELGQSGEIDFSMINCEDGFSIVGTVFGKGENNNTGKFDFSFIELKKRDFVMACVFDDGDVFFASSNLGEGTFYLTNTVFGKGLVDFRETNFGDGNCYFSNVNFGHGDVYIGGGFPAIVSTKFGNGEVNFDNVTFGNGRKDFEHVVFGDGEVSFKETKFGNGVVSFNRASFGEGEVNFNNSIFGKGEKLFVRANFGTGNVSFLETKFGNGDINFDSATFDGELINFTNSKLKSGKISFEGTNFKGSNKVFFKNSKFGKSPCRITHINFNGKKISFRSAKFSTIVIWSNLKGDLDLRVKKAKLINLSDSTIYGNIELNRDNLLRVTPKVKELRIIDTKIYGKIHIDYDEFDLENAINNQKHATYKQKASQFRIFKENFRNLGQYDDEDKAYYWFKYHQIRADAEIKEFDNWRERCKKKLVYGFKKIAFEWIGKYGTSPGRVFLTMIIAVLSFAVFYALLPPINYRNHAPLFHSIITFLTIGYGTDYINLNLLGKILSGIEGFLGLFLIAYFTISFARKVTR